MTEIIVHSENQHSISGDLANQYKILPKSVSDTILELYIDDDALNHQDIKEELELFTGKQIVFDPAPAADIEKGLSLYYRKERQTSVGKVLNIAKGDFLYNLLGEAKSLQ